MNSIRRLWVCIRTSFAKGSYCRLFIVSILSIIAIILLPLIYYKIDSAYAIHAVRSGIAKEIAHLKKAGDSIARENTFIDLLKKKDSTNLTTYLSSQLKSNRIGLMGVTDENGYILSRTLTKNARGDNIFLTSQVGRALSNGKEHIESIEPSAFNRQQVILSTGRWVYDGPIRIGSLFSNALTTDTFAQYFKHTYLNNRDEVVFYTRDFGIFGSSFSEASEREVINSVINPNSPFIKTGYDNVLVRMPDGDQYLIRNIVFTGIEQEVTGVLVFVPIMSRISMLYVLLSIFVLIALIYCITYRVHFLDIPFWKRHSIPFLAILTGGSIIFYIVFSIFNANVKTLTEGKFPLYNSTLHVSPEVGIFNTDYEQTINVLIDSGGETINTIDASLTYNPQVLNIQTLDTNDSLCSYFLERSVDVSKGLIRLSCVIVNPGWTGNNGIIAHLMVRALKPDVANLTFNDADQVYANDGLGTPVLRTTRGGTYTFLNASTATDSEPILFSPTHPNTARWYSERTIRMTWKPDVAFDLALEKIGTSSPTRIVTYPQVKPQLFFIAPSDGTYIVRPLTTPYSQSVSPYLIHIDSTPPEKVDVKVSNTTVQENGVVRLTSTASDSGSGMQRTMYLRIDNDLFYPIGTETYVPFSSAGTHTLTVRAFDVAGNYTDVPVTITVTPAQ